VHEQNAKQLVLVAKRKIVFVFITAFNFADNLQFSFGADCPQNRYLRHKII